MPKSLRARLRFEPLECRQVPSTLDLTGIEFRTIDGTNNNAGHPTQGAAETRQIRFGYGAQFPDGFGDAIVTPPQRANPRTISNVIHAQSGRVPSDRHLTDWAFQWGQFLTHDLDLTRTGPQYNVLSIGAVGDFRIPIEDPNDPLGPRPIPFDRSQYDPATGTPDPVPGTTRLNRRETVNAVTSYIDGSQVYGSDPVRAAALRTFVGGKLKTSADGLLPPRNDAGLPNADPFGLGGRLFLAGDVRANEQTGLTVTHALFVREHNRLADRIAHQNPGLTDEQIYQVARRIVGAELQIITYTEYLPAVLGADRAPDPQAGAYSPAVNATVTNSFAHAAFRFGHSQISPATLLVNHAGRAVGRLPIRDAFFNPGFLTGDPGNVERVLQGLASQVGQETDLLLVDGVRNNLFGPPGAGGLDLAALDIQRGRDHGLPDYNTLRHAYGLPRVTSFAEISSDPTVQAKLERLFGTVDNIDPFVGALADDHLPGSSVGALVQAIVGNQFERLRDGDRFFYTRDAFLASDAVRRVIDLDRVSLARVIRWNTHITHIQDNVFFEDSVRFVAAPDDGDERDAGTGHGAGSVVNTRTGAPLALGSLLDVSQVIPVGSGSSRDVLKVFLGPADAGPGGGAVVYGGGSGDDVIKGYRIRGHDPFTVGPRTAAVNDDSVEHSGLELIRTVTPGGQDDVLIDPSDAGVAQASIWHDPFADD
jgi:hypothetical protein